MEKIAPVVVSLILIGLLFYFIKVVKDALNQSDKDWKTLRDLQERANNLNTEEEILNFHNEFVEKANKIHNQYITSELFKIDGYLRGLRKQLKTKD